MPKRTTTVGLLLVGTVLLLTAAPGEDARALPRQGTAAKNAQAAAEKKMEREVKKEAKLAIRKIRASAKAKVKELKQVGKALKTGKGIEKYIDQSPSPAKGGSNPFENYSDATIFGLGEFCYTLAEAWFPEIMDDWQQERERVWDLVEAAQGGVATDHTVATELAVNDALAGAVRGIDEAVEQAVRDVGAAVRKNHSILAEGGFPMCGGFLGPPRPQPAASDAFEFTDPNVIWNYADAGGHVIFTVHFPASDGQGAYDVDVVLTTPDGTPIAEIPGTQDTMHERFWNVSTDGIDPGIYHVALVTTEDDEDCCAEVGTFVVPDMPPPPPDPNPGKCTITTGATFDFGMMSPGTVVLDDFIPFVPRAIVSSDRTRFKYLELGFFEPNDGGSGGITIDFGPNGVPVADEIQFGPGSPGQSFFSVMSPGTMGRESPGSPLTPLHELKGTICIDVRTLQFGSPAASISVTCTGDVIDRMGNLNQLLGPVSIVIGNRDSVNIETD